MTAAILIIAALALSFTGLYFLIRRDNLIRRALDAHAAYEADLLALRENPPQTVAWPPGSRGPIARYKCGCVEHLDGQEPRWEMCSPHKIDAEMDGWQM